MVWIISVSRANSTLIAFPRMAAGVGFLEVGDCEADVVLEDVEILVAMDVMFALLSAVDKANDDIVFFAVEGGVWMFGIDWPTVLQAWFKCLSQACTPVDYARRAIDVIDQFDKIRRTEHIAAASRLATAAQRDALEYTLMAADQ
jgi:hypothetical protein